MSAYGESFAAWRISFAHARPMPAISSLVAEQRVQPPRLAADDLAELVGVEPERLRPEVAELGLRLLRRVAARRPPASSSRSR